MTGSEAAGPACRPWEQQLPQRRQQLPRAQAAGAQLPCCGVQFLGNVPPYWWRGVHPEYGAAAAADSWQLALQGCPGLLARFPLGGWRQQLQRLGCALGRAGLAPRAALSRLAWERLSARALALLAAAGAPSATRAAAASRRRRALELRRREAELAACGTPGAQQGPQRGALDARRAWALASTARFAAPRCKAWVAAAHRRARRAAAAAPCTRQPPPRPAASAQQLAAGRKRTRLRPEAMRLRLLQLRAMQLPAGGAGPLGALLRQLGVPPGACGGAGDPFPRRHGDSSRAADSGAQEGAALLLLLELPTCGGDMGAPPRCGSSFGGGGASEAGGAFRTAQGVVYGWWARCPLG